MPTREEKLAFIKSNMDSDTTNVSRLDKIKYLKEQTQESPQQAKQNISQSESALRGAAQGASLGFADEATGTMEALWNKAQGNPQAFGELYSQYRDESRQAFSESQQANPKSYLAGEVGGGVATAFIPGMAVAKGAKAASTLGKAAKIGGAMGAGYSEGQNVGEVAKDVAIGATTGALTSFAMPFVGKKLASTGVKLKDSAEKFASRALGGERGTIKKLGKKKIQGLGRQALDEKILSPGANTEQLIARNEALKSKGASQMKEVYEAIDKKGKSTFNPRKVAEKVEDELGDFYRSPINASETAQLERTLESIKMRGRKNISLKDAQTLKKEIGRVANWKNNLNITEKEKMARTTYKIVSNAIDEAADKGSKGLGKANLKLKLQHGKKLYSKGKDTEQLLINKQARDEGNKLVGLTDWGLLGGSLPLAAYSGGMSIPATALAFGAKKIGEKYGLQTTAIGLDKISKQLAKSPELAKRLAKNTVGIQQLTTKPMVKDNNKLKGQNLWASKGFEKLKNISDEKGVFGKFDVDLIKDKKLKKYLIEASSYKKGSKGLDKILKKVKQHIKEGK